MNSRRDLRGLTVDRGGTDQHPVHGRRHLLTRYVFPLLLISGFLALVAWACRELIFPPKAVTVVPVISTAAEVRLAGKQLFQAAGWIEPRPTPIRVAALAPGVVDQLLVVENQPVKAGEPIAELVKDDARLARRRALAVLGLRQAELEEAQAALTAAKTRFQQPVHLQASLGAAEASLAKMETELKNLPFQIRRAEADYLATQKQYEGKRAAQGVVAGVEIELAKSKLAAAQALVEELRERAKSLEKEQTALVQLRDAVKTQVELRAEETKARDEAAALVKARAALLAKASVDLAEAELQLERMTIRAPLDGRVFRLFAHPGARLGTGTREIAEHDGSTVVTLYRPDMLQVRVDVRFEDIPLVSLDQPVKIDNPALASPLAGTVLFVSSEADIQKNTLQVKVAISDPPALLKPEMLVDVTFLSPETRDKIPASPDQGQETWRIFVPAQLVQTDGTANFVWLADRSENTARKREVQLGRPTRSGLVEVVRGLNLSSRLVAAGREGLTDGCRIRITGEEPVTGSDPLLPKSDAAQSPAPPTGP